MGFRRGRAISGGRIERAATRVIGRVTSLLRAWGAAMRLPAAEARAWLDAGMWHDSLRDAPEEELRMITNDATSPGGLLHGPAAAIRLAKDGEKRRDVLDAIRYHTVGSAEWGRTGRALYMADYLAGSFSTRIGSFLLPRYLTRSTRSFGR